MQAVKKGGDGVQVDQKTMDEIDSIVYEVIIPGMVPTILAGSLYYSWMAARSLRIASPGTLMTALPYGINTPASICFIFNVMGPACEAYYKETGNALEAVRKGWEVGVIANMIGGVISMLFAFVGPTLVTVTPPAALMIALAGIGFTWLGLMPLLDCFSFARCGLFTLVLGMLLQLGIIKTGPFPPAIVFLFLGTCVGWAFGDEWMGGGSLEALTASTGKIGFYPPRIAEPTIFEVVPDVLSSHIGVILPVAFTGAVGTLLNVNCADRAGDKYPLSETLFVDGLTTCISAMFGSPYGTCVFIGHSQFKDMGGGVAYPLLFAVTFAVVSMGGCFEMVDALVPPYAIRPIIIFIGLMIVSDAFATAPQRHLPACVLGLFPAVADLVLSQGWSPERKDGAWWGLVSIGQGSLILCMLWTCIFVSLIDSKFFSAACWSFCGMSLAAIGLIHQSSVDLWFYHFSESPGPPLSPYPKAFHGTTPRAFSLGYLSMAVLFATLWVMQKFYGRYGFVSQPFNEKTLKSGSLKPAASEKTSHVDEVRRLSVLVDASRRQSCFLPPPNGPQDATEEIVPAVPEDKLGTV